MCVAGAAFLYPELGSCRELILSNPSHLKFLHVWARAAMRHPRESGAVAVGVALAAGVAVYALTRKKVSAEEMERRRREYLGTEGRLVDGTIMDSPSPRDKEEGVIVLIYKYRISGVEYECAQDLSAVRDEVGEIRIDLPVHVKYDGRNPGNSIVWSEVWSGLRQ